MPAKKKRLTQVSHALLQQNRPRLAQWVKEHAEESLHSYAASLWNPPPGSPPLTEGLQRALRKELERLGLEAAEADRHLASLERTRLLQTATHLTVSEGPSFLAMHRLALAGRPEGETYWVGAWSGVPFANGAWSGCMNWSDRFLLEEVITSKAPAFRDLKQAERDRARDSEEKRFALIPGGWRDARVFGSSIPDRMVYLLPHLTQPLQPLLPPAPSGRSLTTWMSQFARAQLESALGVSDVVFFDLNRVLLDVFREQVLLNEAHPLHQLLLHPAFQEEAFRVFDPDQSLFFGEILKKNKRRLDPLSFQGGYLNGRGTSIHLLPHLLAEAVERDELCPGLLICFSLLAFENGLTCLGSFEQLEYLHQFQQSWQALGVTSFPGLETARLQGFNWGRTRDAQGKDIYPLDVLLGVELEPLAEQSLADWLEPLWSRLQLEGL